MKKKYNTFVATNKKGLLQIRRDLRSQGYSKFNDCPCVRNVAFDTYVKYDNDVMYIAYIQKLFD